MCAAAEDFNGQHKKLFSKAVSIYTLKHYNQCQIKYYCSQIMATLILHYYELQQQSFYYSLTLISFPTFRIFASHTSTSATYRTLTHQSIQQLNQSCTLPQRTATMALLCKYYSRRLRLAKAICLEGHVRMVVFCQEWKRTRNITTVDLIKQCTQDFVTVYFQYNEV